MITYIGDPDWTQKVMRRVPKIISPDVVIVQLDRATVKGFSSAQSVLYALQASKFSDSVIVLVGHCPEQDYKANNTNWGDLPTERTHFFDANLGSENFSTFLKQLKRQ